MSQDQNMRKSIVRKAIIRKYNTAKFETMDVIVEHQIEVEWENIDMLRAKSDGITTLVREDFENTQKRVFEELNLNGFSAIVSSTTNNNKRGLTEEEKKDFDALD
jgi:hypothetical protein